MTARVRFAPSPSGQLHVGNARTALFNWLFARRQAGTFVVRIEDTDTERSTRESEAAILDDLRWLGLAWDEGPGVGGPHAPYRQSERAQAYAERAETLRSGGAAYYCFCTPAELDAERAAALAAGLPPKYSGRCRAIDPADAVRRVHAGEAAALRFAVSPGRQIVFADLVRGEVAFSTDVIGDPVIVRSDGRPAYNFAVVVDDIDMRITHVVRGEDHISNTPRQLLIYEAFGERAPAFAHLSLVLGPDHAPLSKRHGATSVAEFRQRGYLPEALVNYLALLGWSPGGDTELVSTADMSERFDLAAVGHSAAVFDPDKLAWMNRHYMKVAAPARLALELAPYFARAGFLSAGHPSGIAFLEDVLPVAVGSIDRLEEAPDRLRFLFEWSAERAAGLLAREADGAAVSAALADELDPGVRLDRDMFRAAVARVKGRTGLKGRALLHPIRVVLTAADSGPELDLAVPAIDRGAALDVPVVTRLVPSCATRARAVASLTGRV